MTNNTDQQELKKFAQHASRWWDTEGELKTLHQINPLRLQYIKDHVDLNQKSVIDIGCGGGILTESMAQCGANVTGIDMAKPVIDAAKLHLHESGLNIEYLTISAEEIAAERPEQYDVVTCLEMLEHVPDPEAIVRACAALVKPGGHIFFSTINRNPKAYLFAIVGAEYILNILPKNTHDYSKFIRPSELGSWARLSGLNTHCTRGIHYSPFTKTFSLTDDVSVNYLLHAVKS
ncbi:MAG TPA: bifunctional 2-polyprenyl-6-hydroxyphenol methylase/3-demethylubiquinol 3-O-methyltransferase UbiG [Gammaproteobacteria bacterium]|nr:bifunctional 2-polyprenyl-6-hydroxyphenol methylase/3-demethylubiquinol 3-O-methyltransferase UbiG [Gammaproteobacteria bacterium]